MTSFHSCRNISTDSRSETYTAKGMMMKIKALLITTALLMLVAPLTSSAFDGDRKGFMLNLGAGFGQGKVSWDGGSADNTGFGTDFKIGGGPSSQVLVYYTNRALWYKPDNARSNWVNGMSAAGVSYFLKPQSPCFFFSGALGMGVLTESDGRDGESGFGFTLGVGYEIVRSFIAEITFMHAGLSGDYDDNPSVSSFMVTFSWLAY